MSKNSFKAKTILDVAGKSYEIFDITAFAEAKDLPFSLKILLENLLRTEDGANITAGQIKKLANWDPSAEPDTEIQFTPARVIMQDFTGVPCIVDLATMREAIAGSVDGSQFASFFIWSAVIFAPSSVRSKFSRSIFKLKGKSFASAKAVISNIS